VAAGGFGNDYLNPKDQESILNFLNSRNAPIVTKEFFNQFEANFRSLGRISTDHFIENLHELRKLIPSNIPIILINQPELENSKFQSPDVLKRYREMNNAMEKFVAEAEHSYLLDIRPFVNHESHLENDLNHYKRKYYRELSLELLKILNKVLPKNVNTNFNLKSIVLDLGLAVYENAKIYKQKILGKNTKKQLKDLLKGFSNQEEK
jgi:hypothetical protein